MATVNVTTHLDVSHITQQFDAKKAAGANLCQFWPDAKKALQILEQSATGFLKLAIAAVIIAGDAACPGH